MRRRGVLLLVLGFGASALAHDADVIYVAAEADPHSTALTESITLTAQTLSQLAPVDADGDGILTQVDLEARAQAVRLGVWDQAPVTAQGVRCARDADRCLLRQGFVELTAHFTCGPGELRQDFRFLSVLPTNYRVVLGTQIEGEKNRAFAQGSFTALTIARARPDALSAFGSALGEGVARAVTLLALAMVAALGLVAGALWWWRARARRR